MATTSPVKSPINFWNLIEASVVFIDLFPLIVFFPTADLLQIELHIQVFKERDGIPS